MGRWEPDAPGRLVRAALELYAERGYDQTTVVEIAERAGVTERTFFRYFADKREVLFDGSNALQSQAEDVIASSPASLTAMDAVGNAMTAIAAALAAHRGPGFARQRAAVVAANPSLQERELLKLANLGTAMTKALRERGVPDPAAGLAAETGVAVFKIAFERWIGQDASGDFAQCIREALDDLKSVTAGA